MPPSLASELDAVPERTESFDVIVIGGGVIGLAAAWRLAERGASVAVLERGRAGSGTSHVAAGMLAPVAEADPYEEPLLRLGIDGAHEYPNVIAELRERTGLDPGYQRCGTLMVARDRDEAESLEREHHVRERLDLEVSRLRPSQARSLEPALAPTVRGALELPDDHAIDPRMLAAALAQAVRRAGGTVREGAEVEAIELQADAVCGARLQSGERVNGEAVVVAAGVWSPRLAGIPDEVRVPLRPVKGQILRLHDPSGPGLVNRVLRMRPTYLVPRGDGRYVLGATMEERGFDTTVTGGAVFELLRDAIELVPGVSELVVDELSAGLRPGTPDNAPVIGPGLLDGLFWATGHYRHGILLAAKTAELIAGAVLDGRPVPDVVSPLRFTPELSLTRLEADAG
jgi:glycine oxidase